MTPAHLRKVAGTEPPPPVQAETDAAQAAPVSGSSGPAAGSVGAPTPPTCGSGAAPTVAAVAASAAPEGSTPPDATAIPGPAEGTPGAAPRPPGSGTSPASPLSAPAPSTSLTPSAHSAPPGFPVTSETGSGAALAPAVQDRLASWVCDLSLLHELTERLVRTSVLDDALHEVLQAGATLVGAHRGAITLAPADGLGPDLTVGLGLRHYDLGALETVRYDAGTGDGAGGPVRADATEADGTGVAGTGDGAACETVHRDLLHDAALGARHREVAAQLGIGAAYALRLASEADGRLGSAVWFYDEPAEPTEARRRLVGLYLRHAAEHLARCLGLARAERDAAALTAELLPARLPRVPGVRMAVRHATGPRGGGDWFDALPLPEGALGLAVGGVTGAGPGAVAAMGRLRASLRAYAVMEGEDPVAVLSDLELLLRLTEPARAATALFAYTSAPAAGGGSGGTGLGAPGVGGVSMGGVGAGGGDRGRKVTLAGAGHCPPLLVGDRRCEYVETSLSAPLNMLSCWEAPSVELTARPGENLLLYTDGLLHRTGESTDRAFAKLHAAAQGAPRAVREDPERLADHVVDAVLPDGLDATDGAEDLVLLVAHFD